LRIVRKRIVDRENWRSQFVVEVIQNHGKNESGTAGFASRAVVFTVFFFFRIVTARFRRSIFFSTTVRIIRLRFTTRTLSQLNIKILLRKYKNSQTENHHYQLQFSNHRFAKLRNLHKPQKN